MISRTSRKFRDLLATLPLEIRQQAESVYRLFADDPYHPSLRFKRVNDTRSIYSARVGIGYRALGSMNDDTITWFWIGSHSEYDRILDVM